MIAGMRQQLGIEEQQIMLLSLSRISYEKYSSNYSRVTTSY